MGLEAATKFCLPPHKRSMFRPRNILQPISPLEGEMPDRAEGGVRGKFDSQTISPATPANPVIRNSLASTPNG